MNNTLRMIVGAIVTLAIAWVVLSLILQFARPDLYYPDNNVNWWTTLWVTLVSVLIIWIVLFIMYMVTGNNKRTKCCDKEGNENKVAKNNHGGWNGWGLW